MMRTHVATRVGTALVGSLGLAFVVMPGLGLAGNGGATPATISAEDEAVAGLCQTPERAFAPALLAGLPAVVEPSAAVPAQAVVADVSPWRLGPRIPEVDEGDLSGCLVRELEILGQGNASEELTQYDPRGRPASRVHRRSDTGETIGVEEWTYDRDGVALEMRTDQDGDGLVDRIVRDYERSDGQIIRREYDNDADGIVDARHRYEYGEFGPLLASYEVAEEGAWRSIRMEGSVYDEEGRRVTVHYRGQWPHDTHYHWDGERVAVEESDHDANGTVDFRSRFQYDGHGRMTTEVVEFVRDGFPDRVYGYAYDSAGRLDRQFVTGSTSWCTTYRYGHHRGPVLMESYVSGGRQWRHRVLTCR